METDIFMCVEKASQTLVALEIEPRGYVRPDDPYFRRGVTAYIRQHLPSVGDVLTEQQLSEWSQFKANENDRDALYKLEGPKISTSVHIQGFKA